MFRRHETRAALAGETGWRRQLHVLIDDLEIIGHSRYLWASFLQSLPYLLLMTVPIYATMRGFGFDSLWGVAFVLMVVLRLGTVVPQAPGNLGLVSSSGGGSPGKDLQLCPCGRGAVLAGAVGDCHACRY